MTRNLFRFTILIVLVPPVLGSQCLLNPQMNGEDLPQVQDVGDGVLITLQRGSLTDDRPTDDAGRVSALSAYLLDHLEEFGAAGVDPASFHFVEAVPQAHMTGPDGDTFSLIALYQMHQGAAIVDNCLMAAFLHTEDGDELRRVRGRLLLPATLPDPPDPDVVPPDRVSPALADLIAQFGLTRDATMIGTSPMIFAAHNIAGYPVTQFVSTPDGGFHRFRAVVDPNDLSVAVIENQPPCEVTNEPPAGQNVAQLSPSEVFPPGLAGLRFIRIQAVRLSDADGSNLAPITPAEVRIWVDAANAVWTPQAKIVFNFDDSAGADDFQTWAATLLNTVPPGEDIDPEGAGYAQYESVGNVWSLLFHHDRLVVFFRARGGGGWSWGPTSTFFVSMPSYTNTAINKPAEGGWIRNDTALSHELGHYFGLAHPFSGVNCFAAVPANSNGDIAGQDPETTADDVSDTNPDLSDTCYPTDSLTCPGGAVVYNSQNWNPPWTNVMSYHDCLPETLSPDQIDVINLTLMHPVRAELGP